MRNLVGLWFVLVFWAYSPGTVWGHGFSLILSSSNSRPTSISVLGDDAYYDLSESLSGPNNLFLGTITEAYGTFHGFAQTAGAWPAYTAWMNVVSPLYFSDGVRSGPQQTGPAAAVLAGSGTRIQLSDLWAGNPYPVTYPHPGASSGAIQVSGSTTISPPLGVSLYDVHEMQKDLYLAAGAPVDGEYGFAFTISARFVNGAIITSPRMVDVFAMSDPQYGGFAEGASDDRQDAATQAIYNAAVGFGVATWSTAASGSWTSGEKWSSGIFPSAAGASAIVGVATNVMRQITLDGPRSLGTLVLANSTNSAGYAIASGTLTLDNLGNGGSINVNGGSHAINAATRLADDLTVTLAPGSSLQISGNVSQSAAGKKLNLLGQGTLVLSGSNSYSGGTTVSSGTLAILSSSALPSGSSLRIGVGGTLIFDPSASAAPTAAMTATVPEPGTLCLLVLGVGIWFCDLL